MKLGIRHIVALSILLLSVQPMIAQTDDAGQDKPVILYSGRAARYEIADIVVTGIEENNHKTLIKLSCLSVGQRVTVPGHDITDAMKRLWGTGLFANVKIRALRTSGDKIWLEMYVEQNPKIKDYEWKQECEMKRFLVFLACLGLVAEELPDMVVTASRVDAHSGATAQNVEIISGEHLELSRYQTVMEALQNEPGITLRTSGPHDSSSGGISLRGMNVWHW